MTTITRTAPIGTDVDTAWEMLRDFGAVDRLVPGFVTDCRLDDDGARIVTFFNGAVTREVLVSVDDDARRLVYSVVEGLPGCTHYNAAAQIDAGRFVWTIDLLPDALGDVVGSMMDEGIEVIRATLA